MKQVDGEKRTILQNLISYLCFQGPVALNRGHDEQGFGG